MRTSDLTKCCHLHPLPLPLPPASFPPLQRTLTEATRHACSCPYLLQRASCSYFVSPSSSILSSPSAPMRSSSASSFSLLWQLSRLFLARTIACKGSQECRSQWPGSCGNSAASEAHGHGVWALDESVHHSWLFPVFGLCISGIRPSRFSEEQQYIPSHRISILGLSAGNTSNPTMRGQVSSVDDPSAVQSG